MIDKVIKTNYDDYIVVRYWSGNVKAFEGMGTHMEIFTQVSFSMSLMCCDKSRI